MIQLNDIHLVREEKTILQDVNLHMKQGEHWVILGKNGSGKTTILELITGYMFPSSGKVNVLGNTYGECDVREVRKSIGYISQTLFEKLTPRDPVWEVVATGEYGFLRFYELIEPETVHKAIQMLERVGLAHLKNHSLGTLSQGERKKVMLARALMTNPSILIMDEPCAGLDLYEREKLLKDINGLGDEQMQIVYVTHHIEEIVPMFTHVALVDQGKILVAGEKSQVVTAEHLQNAYHVPLTIDWFRDRPWLRVLD
jgi:iron complex transport system ATP-binding protein